MKFGILASGNLGLISLKKCIQLFKIEFIATDSNSKEIIDFAAENNIILYRGNPRENKLNVFIQEHNIKTDIIFSINYLFLLDRPFLDNHNFCINFHGSLLPKYRGRTPHIWSIINNEKKTGVTAHLIDENCDTGKIILQHEIIIDEKMTGAIILERYFKIYPEMISSVFEKIMSNSLIFIPQDEKKASYFGKRTPEDGQINWNWQKERIYNWVRAQASPYPGAFTFVNDSKLIIDEIALTDFGFNDEMENGLVLEVNPNILIKTPNGVVQVTKYRCENIKLDKNTILK